MRAFYSFLFQKCPFRPRNGRGHEQKELIKNAAIFRFFRFYQWLYYEKKI